MKDITNNNLSFMSDDTLIIKIGNFIKFQRLQSNKTQSQLAEEAGINRTTLSELELGRRCQLLTLIQVLRALNQLHLLKDFEVTQQISPIKLTELEMKSRKRASRSDKKSNNDKSDW